MPPDFWQSTADKPYVYINIYSNMHKHILHIYIAYIRWVKIHACKLQPAASRTKAKITPGHPQAPICSHVEITLEAEINLSILIIIIIIIGNAEEDGSCGMLRYQVLNKPCVVSQLGLPSGVRPSAPVRRPCANHAATMCVRFALASPCGAQKRLFSPKASRRVLPCGALGQVT